MTERRPKRIPSRSYKAAMIDIYKAFQRHTGRNVDALDLDDVVDFAIERSLWCQPEVAQRRLCKRDLARALRGAHHVDMQGRKVRTYQARKVRDQSGKQRVFWDDIRIAPSEHIEMAFNQRRNQIVGHCRQLKDDVESYNENNPDGGRYQLELDFRDDIAELCQPKEFSLPSASGALNRENP